MRANRRDIWTAVLAAMAFASLASLSFVATPVKFLAQDVPLAHLLAVGRVTFRASLAVENVFLVALLLSARGKVRLLVCVAAALLLFQWIVLMPRLDERTLARIAGATLAPTSLHHWWIVFDVAKLGVYALIGHIALRSQASIPRNVAH